MITIKDLLSKILKARATESHLYRKSSNSEGVLLLQTCLNDLGFKNTPDGDYGGITVQMVKNFATQNGFDSDGEKVTSEMVAKLIALTESENSKALADFSAKISSIDSTPVYLSRRSKYKDEIIALQNALYKIGYSKPLNWESYGADGDYGGSTTAGVLAFAQKNNFDTNGETITFEMFQRIIHLEQIVEPLKILSTVESIHAESPKEVLTAFQNVLFYTGNVSEQKAEATYNDDLIAAVKAFTEKETLTFEEVVTSEIIQKLIALCENGLGEDWKNTQIKIQKEEIVVTKVGNGVEVSDGTLKVFFKNGVYQQYRGVYKQGDQMVEKFLNTYSHLLEDHNISRSAINVMRAVSVNEGNLDAINTYDGAFLSFGIFQWTIGVGNEKGELPALLKKIKLDQPETFQKYFGVHGLDVSDADTDSTYGYFKLDKTTIKTPNQKETFRTAKWAFIFWKAGQEPIVQAYEIMHAIARLKNFYWREKNELGKKSISDFISSEYGLALLLDQNVNRPNDVYVYTQKALEATGLQNSETWTTAEERKLVNSYILLRNDSKMNQPKERANRTTQFLKNGIISDERLSFQYNEVAAKGIENKVQPPEGFNQYEFPEFKNRLRIKKY